MLVRIAVLVSGGGTNLQALIDAQKSGALKSGKLALVVSNNPGAYALTRAKEDGIPAEIIEGADFESKLLEILRGNGIDIIVLAGFMRILSTEFTAKYPRRILNVHPSLIPSFCGRGFYGLRVHRAALEYGVKLTGATVHFVNEIPDGGEIIMQKAVEVIDGDTPETLQRRVMEEAEWAILPAAAERICAEMVKNQVQKGMSN
ncbi:MAG: phosphoribosylglycinamide formyltransferase [Oscillospiraceae bacterium]|nr:phosphoribosylglycinamide formyltransferase [Oscillospiraceae bacterium]